MGDAHRASLELQCGLKGQRKPFAIADWINGLRSIGRPRTHFTKTTLIEKTSHFIVIWSHRRKKVRLNQSLTRIDYRHS